MDDKCKVGFTIGDVNGIGPEVLLRALSDARIHKMCTPVIYASNRIISFYKKVLDTEGFSYSACHSAAEAHPRQNNIVQCINEEVVIEPGKETETGGKTAMLSLEAAAADLLTGQIDVLVTAPVSKKNLERAGFPYPGQTEFFAAKASSEGLMLMLSGSLRMGLVSGHIPLGKVAASITTDAIMHKLRILHQSLISDFALSAPRIAVLGLNPHAGDQGLLGTEEGEIIMPAIRRASEEHMLVFGPFPADGFFGAGAFRDFDAVLAMYHDQGLVVFKALSFESGVNFTAGLPFIRTSPDHGTAFDIAGKNCASSGSMLAAIFQGIDIYNTRTSYRESGKNPLKRSVVESERG